MSDTETTHANYNGSMIKPNQKEILFGIKLDSELKLEDHVNFLCKKGSQMFYVLAQIAPIMNLRQRRNIMKAFVKSQFGYCPLSNKIKHIHERALRITHRDKSSTLQELLENGNSVSIHHRNVLNFQ